MAPSGKYRLDATPCGTDCEVRVFGRVTSVQDSGFVITENGRTVTITCRDTSSSEAKIGAWMGITGVRRSGEHVVEATEYWYRQDPEINYREESIAHLPEVTALNNTDWPKRVKFRSELIQWLRNRLNEENFLEVQTPILHEAGEGNCTYQCSTKGIGGETLYLRTDPEEYLKRYLTAGIPAVYEICANIRPEVCDETHLQEFTSLECYKRLWRFEELVNFVITTLEDCFENFNQLAEDSRKKEARAQLAIRRRHFSEILRHELDIPEAILNSAHDLAALVRGRGWWSGTNGELDGFARTWLEWILDNKVLPNLDDITLVENFPVSLGLSAKMDARNNQICARGELYWPGGFELVHLYENINDPREHASRYRERLKHRSAGGMDEVQYDEQLEKSMAIGMPPLAGFALGVDRLCMLLNGDTRIGNGLLFPRQGCGMGA